MREEDIVRVVHRCIDESPRIDRVEADIHGMKADIHGMKADIHGMKADIHGVKADIDGVKADIDGMKADIHGMKADIHGMKADIHRNSVLLESLQSDMRKVIEVVVDIGRRLEELPIIRETLQRLGDRQDALENALRRHVKNRKVHRSVDEI